MNNAAATNRIQLPTAEDLDTADQNAGQSWKNVLYISPAEESEDGLPHVFRASYIGNECTLFPTYHERAYVICTYGARVSGDSVLRYLEESIEELQRIADSYEGCQFDGSNHIGHWCIDKEDIDLNVSSGMFLTYWDADEWLRDTHISDLYEGELRRDMSEDEIEDIVSKCLRAATPWPWEHAIDEDELEEELDRMVREEIAVLETSD